MNTIVTGLLTGVLLSIAFALLIQKAPQVIRELMVGHYLITDVGATAISFFLFPVVGAATLLSTTTFCILITIYLAIMRKRRPYRIIRVGGRSLIGIYRYNIATTKNRQPD